MADTGAAPYDEDFRTFAREIRRYRNPVQQVF